MDDLKIKQPLDATKVNTSQDHEMNYWAKKWGVSKKAIEDCVRRVGNSAAAVEKCLESK